MTFEPIVPTLWDVVIVPFPFVESSKTKPRPVLIISNEQYNFETDHCIACMITSAKKEQWYGDLKIKNLTKAGLNKPSILRLKLFTLDTRLITKKIGSLSKQEGQVFLDQFVSNLI